MTVAADVLNSRWNALRNEALGRGTMPLVPEPLATEVANAYEAWRPVYKDAARLGDKFAAGELNEWVDRLNALAPRVAKALGKAAPVPAARATTAYEDVARTAADTVTHALAGGAGVLLGGAAAVGILYAMSRR